MRIIHLLSQKELTGAEVYAVHLAEVQQRLGHEVSIFSDQLHLQIQVPFESWSVHDANWWQRRQSISRLRKRLRDADIHIIHAHSRAALRLAAAARRGTPTALISTVHGRQHFSWSKRIWDIYGDRVIAICENIAEHLKTDFQMNPRKLLVLRNPFHFAEKKTISLVEKTSNQLLPPLKISLIGRFSGPKGAICQALVREVFAPLLSSFPNLKIDLVGHHPERLGTTTLAKIEALQMQHPGRLQLLTKVERLEDYWPQAGDFIIGAGRVAVEATLAGRAVFALGEAQWNGLITADNLTKALSSNFGDIGFPEAALPLDPGQIFKEISAVLERVNNGEKVQDLIHLTSLQAKLSQEFDSQRLLPQILRIYESAWLQRQIPRGVPILMYHQIVPAEITGPHRIFVSKDQFEKHLRTLQKTGCTPITFAELCQFRKGERPLSEMPKKPVILTFDDGFRNNLEWAIPLLKKFKMKAVFFLLADLNIRENSWDGDNKPLLSPAERLELAKTDCEIGSHGFRHQRIIHMNPSEAWTELHDSKVALAKEFSRPISTYAFTYGNSNLKVARMAAEAGYEYALNTDEGGLHIEEDPYQVFRVSVFPEDGPSQIKKKTSWWYRKYYYWKRGR